ncbi:hypothetical protein GA0116948_102348 [Chitinophaga costaii]|uniref:Uncharacterized protein n=1 Tax=Chitinophaga costaii TaxID=1335309 RepID=A0A1C4AYP7_9BACT|nr:hypothetical protein GA0116948_102348 [Chitinophaga costaii]
MIYVRIFHVFRYGLSPNSVFFMMGIIKCRQLQENVVLHHIKVLDT